MIDYKKMFISVRNAKKGIRIVFQHEQNFRFQTLMGALALIAAVILKFSAEEYAILMLTITSVLAAEMLNSIMERFLDVIKPRLSEYVNVLKDMLAGVVLVVSLGAIGIAGVLYIPKILESVAFVLR